ncbi:hypothetical protein STENM327S_09116 [Streptomyces tendae]
MTQPATIRRVPSRRPRLLDLFCRTGAAFPATTTLGVAA